MARPIHLCRQIGFGEWRYDLTRHQVSEGTYHTRQVLYTQLEPFETSVKKAVITSPVVHFDETGMPGQTTSYGLHSASTATATNYTIHRKRSRLAMEAAGMLASFTRKAVHAGWSSYWHDILCRHALYHGHHEGELTGVEENTR